MQNYFETVNGKIYCKKDCEFILQKDNVEILPNGNLDVLLFGNLVVIHNPEKKDKEFWTITLSTRVEMSIYSLDQYYKDEDGHFIVMYNEGDEVIKRNVVPVAVDNVEEIFDMLLGGRVSSLIPYYDYYDIVSNAIDINCPLGFPRILLELLLAETFVDSSGKRPARLVEGDNGKALSINNNVLQKNTFNSMTFEDWSKATFMNKKRSFTEQEKNPSVLEKYMRK